MNYKPPQNIQYRDTNNKYIFLGGSIEMGKAIDWQNEVSIFLNTLNIGTFNPRRDDWNPSWEQEHDNPEFNQQVNWELNALDKADRILINFIPETMSPISLVEFGLYADSRRLAVVCPQGYWKKGNVDIVCVKKNIPLFNTLDEYYNYIKILVKNNNI